MSDLRIATRGWRLHVYFFSGASVIGLVWVLLSFDFDRFDSWLNRRGGWSGAIVTVMLDYLILCVGLIAAFVAAAIFFPERWGVTSGPIEAVLGFFLAAAMFFWLARGGV